MNDNILDSMTEEQIISAGMRLLGMRTSKRKAKSSAKNGRLAWSKKRKRANKKSIVRRLTV